MTTASHQKPSLPLPVPALRRGSTGHPGRKLALLAAICLLAGCAGNPARVATAPSAALAPSAKPVTITASEVFNLSMTGQTWVFANGYGDESQIEVQAAPVCVAGVCGGNVVFHYTKTNCRAYWQPGVCGAELWFTLHRETDGSWRDLSSKIRFPHGCPYELCRPRGAPATLTQNVLPVAGRPLPYTIIPATGNNAGPVTVRTAYTSHWQHGVLTDEPVTPDFPVREVQWSTGAWVETVTTPLTGQDPVNCLVSHQIEDTVEEHWCFAPGLGLVSVVPVRAGKPLDPRLAMKRVR